MDLKVHILSIKPHGLREKETCRSTTRSKFAVALVRHKADLHLILPS